MPTPDPSKFVHRLNPSGTFDSICTACYLTIAQSDREEHLLLGECFHQCPIAPLSFEDRSNRLQQLRSIT